jgi:ABC-type transport system substrate-binding protein
MEPWHGGGSPYTLPKTLTHWDLAPEDYAKSLEWKQPKDEAIAEALRLLGAAGYTRTSPLAFTQLSSAIPLFPFLELIAQLFQDQLRRNGQGVVQSRLELKDGATQLAAQAQGDFDLSGPIARGGHFDPDQVFRQIYYTNGGQNFGKYSDPKLEELIDKQRTIFDTNQRKAAVKDVIRYLIDNAPYTNFGAQDTPNAAQLKVQNWAAESARQPGFQYEHVWLDA